MNLRNYLFIIEIININIIDQKKKKNEINIFTRRKSKGNIFEQK